ncbi:non-ribosomal peptide synthetase [Phytohabitans houttuyneae]|uniref:Carrier domain-containing protein n=1 Tax=Phytohabitans houttuyneae TaxID=1076126 RepID=A0A6V8K8G5_9ACTN|nr:thioesterase domain-containing protein [Phytohabitans houttuyneae]GFJ78037.1 hypothetical protein Phou_022170 [Phytohabitans houttuyneae]
MSADPIAGLLLDAFRDVMCYPELRTDENLFEAGCTSRMAMEAMGRVRRHGISVDLRDILERPFVEQLARHAAEEVMFDGRMWAPFDLSGRFVPIKAHGTGQPLVVVHPAIGEPLSLWNLGVSDVPCPILGVRAVGLDPGERPLAPMERIASRYLADLAAAGIGHPHLLGGYSMGGLVALEMARQLVEAGQPAKLLVIFDTVVPELRADHSRGLLDVDLAHVRRHRHDLLLGELRGRTGRDLPAGASYADIHEALRQEGVLEPATTLDRFIRIQEVWCHNTYSALRYACRPVPVDTVYFRGTRTGGSDLQREYWAALQRGHITFIDHAEDHDTLMRSRAVGRDVVELLARSS